jgi:hypothetical protein
MIEPCATHGIHYHRPRFWLLRDEATPSNHESADHLPFPTSRLPQDLTPLVTSLLPICNRETCPEMKAAEWVYLCVAHPGATLAGTDAGGGGGEVGR